MKKAEAITAKSHIILTLPTDFERSSKAFEYRMQNISYVYALMGRSWISGLKPAKNVGSNVATEIERLIGKVENRLFIPVAGFQAKVTSLIKSKKSTEPKGSTKPKRTIVESVQYVRDAEVVAWV